MVEIIELGELKTVEDATYDQCDETGIDGTSCGGKMISVPAIPNYYGRTKRHLMCQNHIHNYWGAIAWYEQENNLKRLHGKPVSHIRFYDGSTELEAEEFEAQSVGYPGWKDCGCPASKMYVAGDYSRCFEIYCENCEEVEGSSRGMGHGNPGDALIAQICATQMRELLAARTFNPSIDGFRVLNHELLVSSSSSNYSAENFASETCECGELEADDGEIYECNCCDEIFCIDCIENGDISACTIRTGDNPIADHPRIEETETGYMGPQGAICGECMSAIEYELDELPPIHEVMEEDQGTANFSMEGDVQKKSNLMDLALAGAIIGLLTFSAMKRN